MTDEEITAISPLRVEASHRRFFRLHTNTRNLIVMLSPPALERNEAFCRLSEIFSAAGIPVAKIYAEQSKQGWYLMQDLGSRHIEDVYPTTSKDQALKAAIDLLGRLRTVSTPDIEAYTIERMAMELNLYNEWFCQGLLGLADQEARLQPINNQLINAMITQPYGCVHRDYHCRNLMVSEDVRGIRLGVVDFQDALRGPILYDLASLLRDCYWVFSETEIDYWFHYYLAANPRLGVDSNGAPVEYTTLKQQFDYTAVQRQLKAVGIFARLHLRDGKSSHLAYILPLLHRLAQLCDAYPQLSSLKVQLADCMKPAGHLEILQR